MSMFIMVGMYTASLRWMQTKYKFPYNGNISVRLIRLEVLCQVLPVNIN